MYAYIYHIFFRFFIFFVVLWWACILTFLYWWFDCDVDISFFIIKFGSESLYAKDELEARKFDIKYGFRRIPSFHLLHKQPHEQPRQQVSDFASATATNMPMNMPTDKLTTINSTLADQHLDRMDPPLADTEELTNVLASRLS